MCIGFKFQSHLDAFHFIMYYCLIAVQEVGSQQVDEPNIFYLDYNGLTCHRRECTPGT